MTDSDKRGNSQDLDDVVVMETKRGENENSEPLFHRLVDHPHRK
jgi:hypothetical protein